MKQLSRIIMISLTVLGLLAGGWASTAAAAEEQLPGLKRNPLDLLKEFEQQATGPYRVGEGDEIDIQIAGRPQLSGKHVIGPDGKITLPVAGSIDVSGLLREEVEQAVVAAYDPLYEGISCTVRIDKYAPYRVVLLGQVGQPGAFYFERTPTLLEVLTRGNAFSDKDGKPSQFPAKCAVFRGSDQAVWIALRSLLEAGSPLVDMRLKRNDLVYVPAEKEAYLSVLGMVEHPGVFKLDDDSNVVNIIAQAGGFKKGANQGKIQIVQPATGKSREIAFKELMVAGNNLEITLNAGDVIYVPKSGFSKFGYVLETVAPLGSFLFFGSMIN